MRKLILLLIIALFCSCKTSKPIMTGSSTTVLIEKQVDTVLFAKPDSSSILALIRCDSLGNAYLSEITELKIGRATTPEIKVKDNYIYLKCKVDSMAVYQTLYRKFESSKDTASTVITVYKDKPTSAVQRFCNGLLTLLLGALLSIALYLYFKKKWA